VHSLNFLKISHDVGCQHLDLQTSYYFIELDVKINRDMTVPGMYSSSITFCQASVQLADSSYVSSGQRGCSVSFWDCSPSANMPVFVSPVTTDQAAQLPWSQFSIHFTTRCGLCCNDVYQTMHLLYQNSRRQLWSSGTAFYRRLTDCSYCILANRSRVSNTSQGFTVVCTNRSRVSNRSRAVNIRGVNTILHSSYQVHNASFGWCTCYR